MSAVPPEPSSNVTNTTVWPAWYCGVATRRATTYRRKPSPCRATFAEPAHELECIEWQLFGSIHVKRAERSGPPRSGRFCLAQVARSSVK